MKKFLALALSIIFVLSALSACGSSNDPTATPKPQTQAPTNAPNSNDPAPEDPVEDVAREKITFTVRQTEVAALDDEIGQYIQEAMNIEIKPVIVQDDEMLAVLAAADELPDMFGSITFEDPNFYTWIEQGIVREIPRDMIDKYSNIVNVVNMSRESNIITEFLGGRHMYLPTPSDIVPVNLSETARYWYRKDWAAALGIEEPKTTDDFAEMLRAFTEDDPDGNGVNDTIGLVTPGNWFISYLITAFSGLAIDGFSKEDGRWIYNYYSDKMIPGLEYVRDLYSKGYIDPEYSVVNANASMQKFGSDVAGALLRNGGDPYWIMRTSRWYRDAHPTTAGSEKIAWENHLAIMPPIIAPGQDRAYTLPRTEPSGVQFSYKVDDTKLDRILEYLNWGMEPEQVEMARYGMEGVTYAKSADGRISLFMNPDTGAPYSTADVYVMYPSASAFLNVLSQDFLQQFDVEVPSSIDVVFRKAATELLDVYDSCVIDEGDGLILRFISLPEMVDIQNFINHGNAYAAIIMGNEPVADMFAAFKSECDSMGMTAAIDAMTAYMAANGH